MEWKLLYRVQYNGTLVGEVGAGRKSTRNGRAAAVVVPLFPWLHFTTIGMACGNLSIEIWIVWFNRPVSRRLEILTHHGVLEWFAVCCRSCRHVAVSDADPTRRHDLPIPAISSYKYG